MQLFVNYWATALVAAASDTAEQITVPALEAAKLSGLGTGDHYLLTLYERDPLTGAELRREIVRATDVSDSVITVERGQEGTTAQVWDAGHCVEARLTKGSMEALRDSGGVELSDSPPAPLGLAAPGSSAAAARGDHVHALPFIPETPADIGAATAAQGALAETALQGGDVAQVAFTGDFFDLQVLPTAADIGGILAAEKGAASGVATLGSDAKIPLAQLPATAITSTFVVNTEAAMLALAAQEGDVAVRPDISTSFILAAEPASTLANWQELLSPAAGGGAPVGSSTPQPLGSASPGVSTSASRQDHVHQMPTAAEVGADPAGSAAAAQAAAVQRNNHSGTQLASTISDFAPTVRTTVLTGLSLVDTAVVAATDTMLQALGKLAGRLSLAFDRANHTGSQAISTVAGLQTALDGKMTNPMTAAGDIITGGATGAPQRLAKSTDGKVLKIVGGVPAWADEAAGGGGGLTNLTETKNSSSPNVSVPAVALKLSITEANGDLVLESKGTGATLAQTPDLATAGGAKRGNYATDWQKGRTTATQVASGSYSCIPGGYANTASGQYSFAYGHSSVASGNYSLAFGDASSAAAEGTLAVGKSCSASGNYGWATGYRATDRGVTGMNARSAGGFYASGAGAAQSGWYPLTYQTTDATPSVATTNQYVGGAATVGNQVTLPDNSAYRFDGKIVARSSGGNVATWDVKGLVKRGSGAGSVTLVGTPTVTQLFADPGATSWVVAVGVNTTLGCLTFTLTGAAGTVIRWNAAIDTTEVSFA